MVRVELTTYIYASDDSGLSMFPSSGAPDRWNSVLGESWLALQLRALKDSLNEGKARKLPFRRSERKMLICHSIMLALFVQKTGNQMSLHGSACASFVLVSNTRVF